VSRWLNQAGEMHRAAAGSPQFYADAARMAVEAVGLDAAWVLKHDPDLSEHDWQIVGSCLSNPQKGIGFDREVLKYLQSQRVAWYQPTSPTGPSAQAVVIAPVLNEQKQLTGAIYGVRDTRGENRRQGIRPLEARLIQLLAESVAVGNARLEQETEATRTRVLLEHAFSPTVAAYIQQHPECMSGQEREVTLLFADLRGYTSLAESLEPAACYALLGDVMESLTQVVIAQRGVVVDYYGDGLLALWNAPLEQLNHADLACMAATEMFGVLPEAGEKWEQKLNRRLELGIGIHTGPAQVGNAGTRSRLKYGPRGNTVNVASRVQTASKQLQLPLVITGSTQTKLSSKFFTLRACTAKLPGLEQPTELFTVYPAAEAERVKGRLDEYARALQMFESGRLDEAELLLQELVKAGRATPAQFLAHYTAAQKNQNLGRRAVDKYATLQGPVIEILAK
ncbi:MAG: adenylate/guanylate cyclase domain-containing protein, partial [Pirellulales bacterium]|nr:adenylate/guanylate cyclase domain-containing protein [Pirellulales bacterium]